MLDTRRCFLKSLAGASGSLLIVQSCPPIPRPRRRTQIDPPAPAEKQDADSPVNTQSAHHAQLLAQEKQFRETIARLFAKVNDLRLQVEALHSSDIFSIAIFKQTQEIEKLAKQLKNYARA